MKILKLQLICRIIRCLPIIIETVTGLYEELKSVYNTQTIQEIEETAEVNRKAQQ